MTARHVLTIEPDFGYGLKARLVLDDETDVWFSGREREQLIAKAQRAIEQFHEQKAETAQRETIVLDEFGEIVREPSEHSIRVVG